MRSKILLFLLSITFSLNSPAQSTKDESATLPPASSAAQKLYGEAKDDLLQVRVLLKNGRSQASVGSGFMVGESNLVVTNYHVVSQIALEPEVYLGEYVDTQGQRGPIELLAVDVLHDLAVLRVARQGKGFFAVPERESSLKELNQGQYLYSLGNPLDLGFAISEGAYNGVISRDLYDRFMFTGPINSGMSGGPAINAQGLLIGVNVSKRTDGELVSFLVPAKFVVQLINQVKGQKDFATNFVDKIGTQLLTHQSRMLDSLLSTPLTTKKLGTYRVPMRESEQMRCWGNTNTKEQARYVLDSIHCGMESSIYVSDKLQTGLVSLTHSYIQSESLNRAQFSKLKSSMFAYQVQGVANLNLTAPRCVESFVKNSEHTSLRAVICARAYRKFAGLYQINVVSSTIDSGKEGVISQLVIRGVSFENGKKLAAHFLKKLEKIDESVNPKSTTAGATK